MSAVASRTPMQLTARYRSADGQLLTTGLVETGDFGGARSVFLRPGDWLFGSLPLRAATLLGSCVAVMLWAPQRRVGAMCHCLLPTRRAGDGSDPGAAPDGRYGDEAAAWIEQQFGAAGIGLDELEATIAGGAKPTDTLAGGIGEANLRWAQRWIAERGIALVQQDVGGRVVRRVGFNLADGSVTVAHGGVLPAREG